jgi:ubiquinone/menaquinone biosynthesis C-methylase UbiE
MLDSSSRSTSSHSSSDSSPVEGSSCGGSLEGSSHAGLSGTATTRRKKRETKGRRKAVNRLVEDDLIRRVSFDEYREKVRDVYAGPKGALLATCSLLSLHSPMGERLFRKRKFSLDGVKSILDVGSGAGQIVKHLLKYAPGDARIVGIDLSPEMLRRARQRLRSDRPEFFSADLTHLPFADGTFDCVTCGYVLEHLPDPRTGLRELYRVMTPGARMLLLTTEDSLSGAWTSRLFCCRTYNRDELREMSHECGLVWHRELWFSSFHRLFKAGGICVELVKPA